MSTKKGSKSKVDISVPKKIGGSKGKVPAFKLISYTLKAVIPTGQYANIQPEITVEAETIEQAERALMPYIEALFAKYRDGGVQVHINQPQAPVKPVAQATVPPKPQTVAPQPTAQSTVTEKAPEAPIVLTVPFNRAKSAVESCTSKEALRVVTDQITKSVKLTPDEKDDLMVIVNGKTLELNGKK